MRRAVAAGGDAGRHRQDFLHLGQHRQPERRLPERERPDRHRPAPLQPRALPTCRSSATWRCCPWPCCWKTCAGVYAPAAARRRDSSAGAAGRWAGAAWPDSIRHALQMRTSKPVRPSSMILVPELLKAWTILYLTGNSGKQAPADARFVAVGGARVDAGTARHGALGGPARLPGLRPDRMRLGGQPQPPRRRWRRCRSPAGHVRYASTTARLSSGPAPSSAISATRRCRRR
jgi:hypothetical protein